MAVFAFPLASLGCAADGSDATAFDPLHRPVDRGEVLATVNGQSITESDVVHWLKLNTGGKVTRGSESQKRAALQSIVRQELLAQEAIKRGMDADPELDRLLREKQAEMDALRRRRLANRYLAIQQQRDGKISDAEVEAYFAENEQRLRTRYHILQILSRSRVELEKVQERLESEEPFAKVAASVVPGPRSGGGKPWDMGFVRWDQMPEPWQAAVEGLEPGGVSGILEGSHRRFWIIQLQKTREDPSITLDQVREALKTVLRRRALDGSRANIEERLRERANITYTANASPRTASAD